MWSIKRQNCQKRQQCEAKCVTADVSKREASKPDKMWRHKCDKRVIGQICLKSDDLCFGKIGRQFSAQPWWGVRRRRTRVVDNCPIYFTDTSLPCQRSSSLLPSLLCMDWSTPCKKLISVQCSSLHWVAFGARQRRDSAMQRGPTSAIDQG